MSDSKEFIWTTELVAESVLYWLNERSDLGFKESINYFIKSKTPVPEYEIESFRRKSTGVVEWVLDEDANDGTFINITSTGRGFTVNRLMGYDYGNEVASVKSGNIEIFSVERLSDNEMFALNEIERKWGKILKFRINNGTMEAYFEYLDVSCWIEISSLEKVKPKLPLFTTEDGVKIFAGDFYYPVFFEKICNGDKIQLFAINKEVAEPITNPDTTWSKSCKFFSTKEKAEQYILFNKPVLLSLKEIHHHLTFTKGILISQLESLFKSKINP